MSSTNIDKPDGDTYKSNFCNNPFYNYSNIGSDGDDKHILLISTSQVFS